MKLPARALPVLGSPNLGSILVRLSTTLCALSVVATVGVIFYAGTPSEREWWETTIFLLPWMLWPYALLAAMALRSRIDTVRGTVVSFLVLSVGSIAGYMFVKAFVIELDPQSSIAVIFLPAIQGAMILTVESARVIAVGLVAWAKWSAKRAIKPDRSSFGDAKPRG